MFISKNIAFSYHIKNKTLSLCERYPYSEFFWSVFSRIRTEYGPEKLRIYTFHAVYMSMSNEETRKISCYFKWGVIDSDNDTAVNLICGEETTTYFFMPTIPST